MPDVLIRNVPQETLDALDDLARRQGLSRAELIRRHLLNEARRSGSRGVVRADLQFVAEAVVDLLDEEFRDSRWR